MSCFGLICTLVVEIATFGSSPARTASRPQATPTRTEAQVLQAADDYLKARGIDSSDRKASKPEYLPDAGTWLIAYVPRGDEPRALGEGRYGVFVSDRDLGKIRFRGSR